MIEVSGYKEMVEIVFKLGVINALRQAGVETLQFATEHPEVNQHFLFDLHNRIMQLVVPMPPEVQQVLKSQD